MTARRRRAAAAAWTRLAWRTGEMLLASSEVIAVRTAQLAAAGATPSARDRAEQTRMVAEKWEASVESGGAFASAALAQSMRGAARFWTDVFRLQVDLASVAASASPAQAQARLSRTISANLPTLERWAIDAAERSDAALAPLHRRTAANVRRLRRLKG